MLRAEAISRGAVLPIRFINTTATFPGGEVHVAVNESFANHIPQMIRITAHLRSPADQMALFMLTDAIRRACRAPIHLHMPYVPYARQDRVCNPGEALAAKVFCQMINAQGYESVTIFDPHSDVVPALLDRVIVKDAADAIDLVLGRSKFADGVTFIAPDAGAQKRVLKLAKRFGVDSVVCADKVRDTKTGEIRGIAINGVFPAGKPALVIDDICDGGATFIALSEQIVTNNTLDGPLYLYVSHGIFSKGVGRVAEHYDHVFAGYNWTGETHPNLTTIFKD